MTLRHGNRVRKNGGEQVVRELECLDSVEMRESGPTESEIRQRAYEIYVGRGGAHGSAQLDWLQAECELRARRAEACPNSADQRV